LLFNEIKALRRNGATRAGTIPDARFCRDLLHLPQKLA
jgi:hypothetical protein